MAKKKPPPKPSKQTRTKRTGRSPQGRRPEVAPDWAPAFLDALRRHGTVYHACAEARVGRSTVYDRRRSDEAFAADFASASEDALDVMEREAVRRAVEGYDEPVIYKGELMGEWRDADGLPCAEGTTGARFVPLCIRRYSDRLLAALLRWRRYPDPRGDAAKDDEPPMYGREED